MKTLKVPLFVILLCVCSIAAASKTNYLFDIKLFDITDVSNEVQDYQTLEPFSNPKIIARQGVPASMKMSGEEQEELMFELELLAKSDSSFNLKFELFKNEKLVSGPVLTEGFSSEKTWLMVTSFDGKKLLVTVDMSKSDYKK